MFNSLLLTKEPVKLLKKLVEIGLVTMKQHTRQEISSFLDLGNVFLIGAVEDRVRVIVT